MALYSMDITEIYVLRKRGVDVDRLPREIVEKAD